jgi:hypothetical protein
LREGEYVRLEPHDQGVIESRVFPGLRLNVAALLNGEMAKVLMDLQEGTGSAAHTVFAQNLVASNQNT